MANPKRKAVYVQPRTFDAIEEHRTRLRLSRFGRRMVVEILLAYGLEHFDEAWAFWNDEATKRTQFRRSVKRFLEAVTPDE